jgi:four helix bundle protein
MQSHRNLHAWQKARATTLAIFRYADSNWSPGRAAAIEQLRRAALSVQLNIAEGYASGPGARCRNHLTIAYGSAVETTDILELLQDLGAQVEPALATSRETQALTLRLLRRSPP